MGFEDLKKMFKGKQETETPIKLSDLQLPHSEESILKPKDPELFDSNPLVEYQE